MNRIRMIDRDSRKSNVVRKTKDANGVRGVRDGRDARDMKVVFDQPCCTYLRHMGHSVNDGDRINAPYRDSSDSESFVVNGFYWTDYATGEDGNVYQLALKMNNGNKRDAVKSLFESAGVIYYDQAYAEVEKVIADKEKALGALKKVQAEFAIAESVTPSEVLSYLASRKVTNNTFQYFAYVPAGKLKDILTSEEISLTGLRNREGEIILWYFQNGEPVYYCTRKIHEKGFRKAYTGGALEHPIWNVDALYRDEHLVWAEGMFDCISLIELGYGVAGEITCHLIKKHKPELLKALRWRKKTHPEWTFTICLDNDELTKSGKRPGNEAAEQIASWLWANGVEVKWVKHDTGDNKIDINDLHKHGLDGQIRQMIDGAQLVADILPYEEDICLRALVRASTEKDYKAFNRIVALMAEVNPDDNLAKILKKTHHFLWRWRDVYDEEIQDMFLYCADVYVIFKKNKYAHGAHYEVFKKTDLVSNIRKYQKNPLQKIQFADLDIESLRPTWRVSKGDEDKSTYNLFGPNYLLLQEPKSNAVLPDIWSRVLENLCGQDVQEWLLNHMATYVQTLEKPRTIPVFVGRQGTGKTVIMKLFGEAIGGFCAVGNQEVESAFNSYLMNPVVLLDELASNPREANRLKNKLKSFINEHQVLNCKHRSEFTVNLNNYMAIASNEQVSHVPIVIEKDDRRYTIISGGDDKNLANEDWFDYDKLVEGLPGFMLYLLSRPIDQKKANTPLLTEKKAELIGMSEDLKVAYVREYIEQLQSSGLNTGVHKLSEVCDAINEKYRLQFKLTSRHIIPILEYMGHEVTQHDHQAAVRIEAFTTTTTTLMLIDDDGATTTTTTTGSFVSGADDDAILLDADNPFGVYDDDFLDIALAEYEAEKNAHPLFFDETQEKQP